ncbi:MAG: CHAT domain-containing protein [Chloroflexota bacterium]
MNIFPLSFSTRNPLTAFLLIITLVICFCVPVPAQAARTTGQLAEPVSTPSLILAFNEPEELPSKWVEDLLQPFFIKDPKAAAFRNGMFLLGEGDRLEASGKLNEAYTKWEDALEAFITAEDHQWMAHSYLELGEAYMLEAYSSFNMQKAQLGIHYAVQGAASAVKAYTTLQRRYVFLNVDQIDRATDILDEGIALCQSGVASEGLSLIRKAQSIYEQADFEAGTVQTKLHDGLCKFYDRGLFQSLLPLTNALITSENLPLGDSLSEWYLQGSAQYDRENWQRAINILQQVRDERKSTPIGQLGRTVGLANTNHALGEVWESIGYFNEASSSYETAIHHYSQLDNSYDRYNEADARTSLFVLRSSFTHQSDSKEEYIELIDLWRELGRPQEEAMVLNHLALTLIEQGQTTDAMLILNHVVEMQNGLSPDSKFESLILYNFGRIALIQGNSEDAYKHAAAALNRLIDTHDSMQKASLYKLMAQAQWKMADQAEAAESIRRAVEFVGNLQGDLSIPEFKTAFFKQSIEIYHLAASIALARGQIDEAFRYMEQARAQAFLQQIGGRRIRTTDNKQPTLTEQEHDLRLQISRLATLISEKERERPNEQRSQQLSKWNRQLEEAQTSYAKLLTRLKLTNPEYESLITVDTTLPNELQKSVLDNETTLIIYHVLQNAISNEEQLWAWVIDKQTVKPIKLDMTPDQMATYIEFLRNTIDDEEYDQDSAGSLYEGLITPLKRYISRQNLIIIPHEALHYLPFAALWNVKDEKYLLEEYTVSYAPSASSLRFLQDKRTSDEGRMLVLGNPDTSLIGAEIEAKAIANLYGVAAYVGKEATERLIHEQAGHFDILHLAAHGIYKQTNPLFTRIELAPDEGTEHDGRLEVHELYELDLKGTNIVVLSACQTDLGEQSVGDEITGLTRAFLYAGTPSIITTLWNIDDDASTDVMTRFHQYWLEGAPVAEALRLSQLDVIRSQNRLPHDWAAFRLSGDHLGYSEP